MTDSVKTLKDIADMRELSELFGDFSAVTGLCVTLYGADGCAIYREGGQTSVCRSAENCAEYRGKCRACVEYGGKKAFDLGEPYMYACGCGLIMCSVPIASDDKLLGSIACGPLLLWDVDEVAVEEFGVKAAPFVADSASAEKFLSEIKRMQCGELTSAAHLLGIVVNYMLKMQSDYLRQRREITRQQNEIAEMLLQKKLAARDLQIYECSVKINSYPRELERELIARIGTGDKTAGKKILNDLLGEIFSVSTGKPDIIKARLFELIAILSRAAVDAGAPLEALTDSTSDFVRTLMGGSDFETVCYATAKVLDEFMDTVYKYAGARRAGKHLLNAMAYVDSHYSDEISLEGTAKAVFVSGYYLSHIFRDELNVTFSEYVLGVRMEHARRMLAGSDMAVSEVGFAVGFNDANYFTRAFKKMFGISPGKYRLLTNRAK